MATPSLDDVGFQAPTTRPSITIGALNGSWFATGFDVSGSIAALRSLYAMRYSSYNGKR